MEGTRVVEFGTYLAGPLLGKHLVRFGCDVTSVLRPENARGAAAERAWSMEMEDDLHARKHRVELDLPRQIDEAMDLVRASDVLIDNFSTGTLARLGLSVSACLAANPNLIYVTLPGYAQSDVEYAGVKAWDSVIMGLSGVFCDMGLNRTLLGIEASFSALPMASAYGSIFACLAVVSAIYGGRRGRHIEVPLAAALTEALVYNNMHFSMDRCYKSARQSRLDHGAYPVSLEVLDTLFDPFFCRYICADKRPIYLVCPAHARHQQTAVRVLGIEDEIYAILPHIDPYDASCEPSTGIGSANLSCEQAALVRPILKEAFARLDSTEWERRLGEAGAPAIAHRTTQEWCSHPHATASGLVRQDGDGSTHIAPIGWLSDEEPIDPAPVKRDGEWPASGARTKAPLGDVRVVDLCNVIAGPSIGAFLARMGADVIKVDPCTPTYSPEVAVIYGIAANLGKRSILLDIMHPDGRNALNKLLVHADLLVVNCTREALARARLTRSDLKLINPRLVLVRFDAWGGPNDSGAFSNYVGYDDNIQAGIGIQERFGGDIDNVEEHAHIGTIDVIAGVAGAATAVCALLARRQGRMCTARSSLASVGQHIQYPFMFRRERTIGKGRECRGTHTFHRCAFTANGWIIMAVSPHPSSLRRTWRTVSQTLDVHTFAALNAWLARHSATDACTILRRMGIEAQPLVRGDDLRKRYTIGRPMVKHGRTYQYLSIPDHPIGHLEMVAPVAIRMSDIRISLPHAPKYGQHTIHVLTQLCCRRALLTKGARSSWSQHYLPYASECAKCGLRGRPTVVVACSHSLCYTCLAESAASRACPICSIPHELDIFRLRSITSAWKSAYASWRRGNAHGSSDIETIFRPTLDRARSRSAPRTRHSSNTSLSHGIDAASFTSLDTLDKRG